MSQRAIARRLGISRKTVRRYCLGQAIRSSQKASKNS
ncbi:MAG TPA: helix-turn-helix domain-containing protein [Candidatus Brocadiaceae bacterium]